MKLIILILLFSVNTYAVGFKPVGKSNANRAYSKKAECESKEGQKCFNIDIAICKNSNGEVQPKRCKVGLVNNLDSIKYAKPNIQTCSDLESCQPLFESLDCDGLNGERPIMLEDYSEVYCAVPNGFNKKDGLVPDAIGAATVDAEISAINNKRTARTQRFKDIKSACANAGGLLKKMCLHMAGD